MTSGKSHKRSESIQRHLDQFRETLKRSKDGINLHNLRFIERYVEMECHILLHFTVGRGGVEYVALFHRDFPESIIDGDSGSEINQRFVGKLFGKLANNAWRNAMHLILRADCKQKTVLTDVVKFVQAPEIAVSKDTARRTFVWFDRADYVYNILPKALYFSNTSGFVFRGRGADREPEMIERSLARKSSAENPVNSVIQGTPQILDNISRDSGNDNRDVSEIGNVIDQLARIRIALGPDRIGLGFAKTEVGECLLQVSEMLFGPFNFYPDTFNPFSH